MVCAGVVYSPVSLEPTGAKQFSLKTSDGVVRFDFAKNSILFHQSSVTPYIFHPTDVASGKW